MRRFPWETLDKIFAEWLDSTYSASEILLKESPEIYSNLFDEWLSEHNEDTWYDDDSWKDRDL